MKKSITVFEHKSLTLSHPDLSEKHLKALQSYYGKVGVPYYSLIHRGVRFNSFVGVLQVGTLTIEVLPKLDHQNDDYSSSSTWRSYLIDMLHYVGVLRVHSSESSFLKIQNNNLLHLYFELFVHQVESLIHRGLIKKYRKTADNQKSLNGAILFPKQIQKNLIHQERFFTKHSIYDDQHQLHVILYKTLKLLQDVNQDQSLHSRIQSLLLNFPEMPDIKVTEDIFRKISFNRKSEYYQEAIKIARILLLNYHSDLSRGREHVLALMFDMNALWEKFVYKVLKRDKQLGHGLSAQESRLFWKPEKGRSSSLKPDIKIMIDQNVYVLDTKWKNIGISNPSIGDLRQMFAYVEHFGALKAALVYPALGNNNVEIRKGSFYQKDSQSNLDKECCLVFIGLGESFQDLKDNVSKAFNQWILITK